MYLGVLLMTAISMLVTDVGDKMMNNIQKMSPISKFCHQHRWIYLYLFEAQWVVCWKTQGLIYGNAYTNLPVHAGFAMYWAQWFSFPASYWLHWWNSSKWVNEIWNGNLWDRFKKTSECLQTNSHCLVWWNRQKFINRLVLVNQGNIDFGDLNLVTQSWWQNLKRISSPTSLTNINASS